ncbi:Phosphoserine phosphatase [Aquiflexum balticum DSM 16537]|uniref:phosphoserine phosphatase n=2 Tax=Aquiflexum TaxID=280472 RepID=A0A1W2H7A2_9BACT|nr:Phosphoserine phosphatase [Aquiflexum balticum DSM 16537]
MTGFSFFSKEIMKFRSILILKVLVGLLLFEVGCTSPQSNSIAEVVVASDPLPSWNESSTKQQIIDFVTSTTTTGSPDFVPEADRIAVFDNDGTLWAEQPMYFQLIYAVDFIKKEASKHPDWQTQEPFKSVLSGDLSAVMKGGEKALLEMLMVSHAGMTTEEFGKSVNSWLQTATHPKTGKAYSQMIYQPMLELLEYLRANGYKTFIVSGGGIDFLRVFAEKVYGIPPYQVIGSSIKAKYDVVEGQPIITKLPEINFIDDKEGKPIAIHLHIGKRPVFAAGNSDGDYAMLEYTSKGDGPRFGMIIHHTDSLREYAYDRDSPIGRLEKGLDNAPMFNWSIVDMKTDWKVIFPFD